MAHKALFAPAGRARPADTTNEAGGRAYAFEPRHALAQYLATGTFNRTFYASEHEQLERVLDLCRVVPASFVAKAAVYAREKGAMKDMPALLCAYLSAVDTRLLGSVFARVIDNGRMLRNFVQIVRSGVVGRRSFGTAPKRLARGWFADRAPSAIFRQSLGQAPSLSDVIKLVRPVPRTRAGEPDLEREALYGYLIGKEVANDRLPPVVQAFEAYKQALRDGAERGAPPDVPFEMLTALELGADEWRAIARSMSWTQLRMKLNALCRHGVFADEAMVRLVADKLGDADLCRKARVFPYQLLAAYKAAAADVPRPIVASLGRALEVAIENVPVIDGRVVVCPDVSGSMHSPVTGHRKGATSAVRCVDVAALVAAAILRQNPEATVMPFSDDVVPLPRRLEPRDTVMTNAELLAGLPAGGTACSAPLRRLERQRLAPDLVLYVSDSQSWADFGCRGGDPRPTAMAESWERLRARNPRARLVLVDLQPYATTQVAERDDVLHVGGFSDAVFGLVSLFAKGELAADHWVGEIERVVL